MNEIASNEIKRIMKKRDVLYGHREAKKALKSGKSEKVIISSDSIGKEDFKDALIFNGNSKELGIICGKPFSVSVLTILKE